MKNVNLREFIKKARELYDTFDMDDNLINFLINNYRAIQTLVDIDFKLEEIDLSYEYPKVR